MKRKELIDLKMWSNNELEHGDRLKAARINKVFEKYFVKSYKQLSSIDKVLVGMAISIPLRGTNGGR